ncbi:MAG: septum formation initiator family protein [Actinomycetaceae bacterium]|nr:septum formation initiator family protein [Actinomycetaceae bacterium]MDY5854326.1 septum formation initiator family protein [Arcanobacterium sp.]
MSFRRPPQPHVHRSDVYTPDAAAADSARADRGRAERAARRARGRSLAPDSRDERKGSAQSSISYSSGAYGDVSDSGMYGKSDARDRGRAQNHANIHKSGARTGDATAREGHRGWLGLGGGTGRQKRQADKTYEAGASRSRLRSAAPTAERVTARGAGRVSSSHGSQPAAESADNMQARATDTRAADIGAADMGAAGTRTPDTRVSDADAPDTHAKRAGSHGRADWRIVWEGEKKSHQMSLRMLAILAFAAIAVLIVSTPMRAFIGQQEQLRALNDELAARKAHIEQLQDSIALWNDPEYVQSQARQRLGYVMPGQTLYYVTGKQAQSAVSGEQRIAQANRERRAATPFYMTMWDSIAVAGQVGSAQNPQGVPVIPADMPAVHTEDEAGAQPPPAEKPPADPAQN